MKLRLFFLAVLFGQIYAGGACSRHAAKQKSVWDDGEGPAGNLECQPNEGTSQPVDYCSMRLPDDLRFRASQNTYADAAFLEGDLNQVEDSLTYLVFLIM